MFTSDLSPILANMKRKPASSGKQTTLDSFAKKVKLSKDAEETSTAPQLPDIIEDEDEMVGNVHRNDVVNKASNLAPSSSSVSSVSAQLSGVDEPRTLPPAGFEFPIKFMSGIARACSHHWFQKYPWLEYKAKLHNDDQDSVFCKTCRHFVVKVIIYYLNYIIIICATGSAKKTQFVLF